MEESVLHLLRSHWDDLIKQGQPLEFKKGQVLFYEGHIPYGIFVVPPGRVTLESNADVCPHDRADHLWKSPTGEVLGLTSFLDGSPSCCTSIAAEDCHVVFISRSLLETLLPIE